MQQASDTLAYAAGAKGESVAPKLLCLGDFRGSNLRDEGQEEDGKGMKGA